MSLNFDSQGHLVPKGELKIHSASVHAHPVGIYFPKIIWIDEAGLLWNISRATEAWSVEPEEWPTVGWATYRLQYKTWSTETISIAAQSLEAAIASLKESKPFMIPENITLLKVSQAGPQTLNGDDNDKQSATDD